MRSHSTLLVNLHDTGKGQPVLPLIQGADAVRKLVGKHGNHAVRKIHAGAAINRLFIKWRVLPYIIAHIRNVDPQKQSSVLLRKGDGVVEVLRLLAVDGHGEQITEVLASLGLCCGYFLGNARNLRRHFLGKFRRKSEGFHNRQNIDAGVVDMP